MNHSQTIVSCTMTCALAREHGSEHGSERGTNSPDGRSSGHAYKLPVRIEPVESDATDRCSSTEFRVLSVVRRILGTTLQVISLSFRVFCLRETMLKSASQMKIQ